MATYGYVLLSSNRDSDILQARDIGKSDQWFVEAASYRSVSILKRPEFLEARKSLKRGDTFVVCATDLLSTNPKELLQALQSLRRKGVSVILARARVTLDSANGKAYLALLRSVVKMQVRLQRLQW